MLIKIKAKFVKGDKVSPLILRRLYNKSGHESSSNGFKTKHELAEVHRETNLKGVGTLITSQSLRWTKMMYTAE